MSVYVFMFLGMTPLGSLQAGAVARGWARASFQADDGAVTVRLEYLRLGLVRSRLVVRTYRAEELRGRVLVFRWVRG
jgi:hypothetical protein